MYRETDIVHGTEINNVLTGDLVQPIHMTSTFKFDSSDHGASLFKGETEGYVYSRIGNPTVRIFEKKMALLEGAEDAVATSSGMSAISSLVLALVKSGENIVSSGVLYGGTYALFNGELPKIGIETRFVSPDLSFDGIVKIVDEKTKLLFIETPANPTLNVIDISVWVKIAEKFKIPLAVDNTFLSPYIQRPIEQGADVSLHSTTKYLSGHGDSVGGVVVGSNEVIKKVKNTVSNFGPSMSPFNAWLVLRGLKTLAVRMERHCENAWNVATYLSEHYKVNKVYYPWCDPLTQETKKGGGTMSFELKDGLEAGKTVIDNVKLCALAVSLGDCETLIQHPASMTHASYTKEEREKVGITDGLVRLSVGLEHYVDIIKDLEQALGKI